MGNEQSSQASPPRRSTVGGGGDNSRQLGRARSDFDDHATNGQQYQREQNNFEEEEEQNLSGPDMFSPKRTTTSPKVVFVTFEEQDGKLGVRESFQARSQRKTMNEKIARNLNDDDGVVVLTSRTPIMTSQSFSTSPSSSHYSNGGKKPTSRISSFVQQSQIPQHQHSPSPSLPTRSTSLSHLNQREKTQQELSQQPQQPYDERNIRVSYEDDYDEIETDLTLPSSLPNSAIEFDSHSAASTFLRNSIDQQQQFGPGSSPPSSSSSRQKSNTNNTGNRYSNSTRSQSTSNITTNNNNNNNLKSSAPNQQQPQSPSPSKHFERWIDLHGKQLERLPTELLVGPKNSDFRLTTKLTLRNNKFTQIPEALALLDRLVELDFCENQLNDISALNKFKSVLLSKLWFNGNKLVDISNVQWSKFRLSIKELCFDYNLLESVPISWISLEKLETLSLIYNRIRIIPEEFSRLKALKSLNVYWNDIVVFPASVFKIVGFLDIGNNDNLGDPLVSALELSSSAPPSPNLSVFSSSPGNRNSGGGVFGSLNNSSNSITPSTYQQRISTNYSLHASGAGSSYGSLVSDTNTNYSPSVSRRTSTNDLPINYALTTLNLNSISLRILPEMICRFDQLEILEARDNKLRQLPLSIGQLKRLRRLALADNQIGLLPESIIELKSLETLDLSGNVLKCLPPNFEKITTLQKLILNDNEIEVLPERLLSVNPQLTLVELRRNKFIRLPKPWIQVISQQQEERKRQHQLRQAEQQNSTNNGNTIIKITSDEGDGSLEIYTSLPDEVLPGLFLGSMESFSEGRVLHDRDISAIVRVLKQPPPKTPLTVKEKRVDFLSIPVVDSTEETISTHFDSAFDFIDKALDAKKNVLIHCSAGVSRSPTIVISYLMRKFGMSLSEAFRAVRLVRPIINPNISFMRQLKAFEIQLAQELERDKQEMAKEKEKMVEVVSVTTTQTDGIANKQVTEESQVQTTTTTTTTQTTTPIQQQEISQ